MVTLPKVGELWRDTISGAEGLVLKVTGTIVTFVSLTGVRAPVQFDRTYNPWSRLGEQLPNTYTQTCSRALCPNTGIAWYERPFQSFEVACLHHIPRNVKSSLLTEPIPGAVAEGVQGPAPCPTCKLDDAIEVIGEIRLRDTSLWMCGSCSLWWITATRTHQEIRASNMQDLALRTVPVGYTFQSMTTTQDLLNQTSSFTITVQPKPHQRLTGPRPMTVFDYLLMGDD